MVRRPSYQFYEAYPRIQPCLLVTDVEACWPVQPTQQRGNWCRCISAALYIDGNQDGILWRKNWTLQSFEIR